MYQSLLKPAFIDIKNFVLETLFPTTCLGCEVEGELICADCKVSLKKLEHQRCIVCQKPTPFGLTHSYCQTAYGADGLISFYDYHDEKVAKIIIAGKYHFIPAIYEILGTMIAQKLKNDHAHLLSTNHLALTPIPLHFTRKRWRGFNQAEILCQTLSQTLALPHTSVLVRCKLTKTQKDLKKEKRLKNMIDAFAVVGNGLDHSLRGKSFILVDDVTTTGATLQQAASTLKRAGASKVFCLTVARD